MKHVRSLAAALIGLLLGLAATVQAGPAPLSGSSLASVAAAAPIGTAITYQGRLTDGGRPAQGAYDLRFRLYDAAADGLQVGPTITRTNVLVSNGLLTVVLDFGAVFDGAARYLEVAVAPAGGGSYAALEPRQELTPTPHARFAELAGGLALPFSGSISSEIPALFVSNSGGGGAIRGQTAAGATGSAVTGFNYGNERYAAEFEIMLATNPRAAIYARTAGTGQAIDAEINSATTADALFARTTSPAAGSYAGVFSGPVQISCSAATCNTANALQVVGNFSATVKNFKIDHPLAPATKYLNHTSVESPDMKNIYDGVVVTGADGLAAVELPGYFEALNQDFRYQLTVMGTFAQAIVKEEIAGNRFVIQTDKPGVKVSWQVTGIRHDAYAKAYPIPVEEDKPPAERGTYLVPELFGQPPSRGLAAREQPEIQPAPEQQPASGGR
ncbi:MAG TPA: hypothetical protein VGE07_26360 [Herpetosiphonaceae bacterium]